MPGGSTSLVTPCCRGSGPSIASTSGLFSGTLAPFLAFGPVISLSLSLWIYLLFFFAFWRFVSSSSFSYELLLHHLVAWKHISIHYHGVL
ncbi:hypothetical protein SLEP1_g51534 [Rubroshorea leprosula]|uniref:Uncharacterized protein n=1 Tax=Rubroshorea leprosula TaxID=152421 RepID=A0AAV5M496_9ROSI|nr:hypothetical protein SLEP1_g51534 [Rubroshorea leprosula]